MSLPPSKLTVNRDSKWVKSCLKTWQLYKNFCASASCDLDLESRIIQFLFDRYNNKKKKIRPKNISDWASQLFEQFSNENIPVKPVIIRRIKTVTSNWERFLLEQNDFAPKQPKYLSLRKVKKLTKDLWRKNRTHRCKKLYRAASVAYVFAWLSGARMQDLLRLKWEDLDLVKNNTGSFVRAQIRHSKGNKAKRAEQLTVMIINDHCLNIFTRLKHWWNYCEKPDSGYIFSKTGKAGVVVPYKPSQIKRAAQKSAKALGWKDLPMAKSGRNSIAPLLIRLGVKSQLANLYMRWSHSSEMLSHYQGNHLEYSKSGVAYKLGTAIENGTIFEIEKDIH